MNQTLKPTKDLRVSNPDTLYLTDNGRALCGAHLGASARFTGRDISGQKIQAVRAEDARAAKAEGWAITCESCGKAA